MVTPIIVILTVVTFFAILLIALFSLAAFISGFSGDEDFLEDLGDDDAR
jgi:hypothetical protein